MNAIMRAARLHLIGMPMTLGLLWGNLALVFAINLFVFALIGDRIPPGRAITGAVVAVYIVMLVIFARAMTQLLPFAMALSLTRRTFYLGTSIVVLGLSATSGMLLLLAKLVEDATDGWGLDVAFYGVAFLADLNPPLLFLAYTVPLIATSFIGILMAVVYKRWGIAGAMALWLVPLLLIGAFVAIVTWLDAWLAVGRWFVDQSVLNLVVSWPAVIAAVCAGASYLMLRRVTP
jgi:uncharacterized membrane protein (UPF0136 family)